MASHPSPKKPKYKILNMVSTERLSLLHHCKAKKLLSQSILSQYNLKRRHLGSQSSPTVYISSLVIKTPGPETNLCIHN